MKLLNFSALLFSFLLTACASLSTSQNSDAAPYPLPINQSPEEHFIQVVAPKYGLTQQEATQALAKATFQPSIIRAITKPAEGKRWGDYRDLLITPKRVQAGKDFIHSYPFAFNEAQRKYHVPSNIIASIIGVETFYGKNTGKYRVLDALSTLSFGYPKRAAFFESELAKYLILCKKNQWPVEKLKGSYAGAFGFSQFMPSSYLNFAVSAYPGAQPDLYNPNDAILSVAHYLEKNGWQEGAPIAIRVKANPSICQTLTCNRRKPTHPLSTWIKHGVKLPVAMPEDLPASLITLDMDDGQETWLIFHNFYVITTYNTSINYAMAVFELSKALREP